MSDIDETILHVARKSTAGLLTELASLPPAERLVAETVLAHPAESMRGSIGQLASRSETSPATVVRLARRLGYDGFADWKIALAEEQGRSSQFGHAAVPAGSPTETAAHHTLADDADALRVASRFVDPSSFNAAVDHICDAAEVLFLGVGTSGSLAELAAYRFSALGIRAHNARDALGQHLATTNLSYESTAIAISHTGSTKATILSVRTAQEHGATVIGITSSARSPLAETADVVLITGGDAAPQHLDVFANRVVHLSLLGALHSAAARRLKTPKKGTEAAKVIARHQF